MELLPAGALVPPRPPRPPAPPTTGSSGPTSGEPRPLVGPELSRLARLRCFGGEVRLELRQVTWRSRPVVVRNATGVLGVFTVIATAIAATDACLARVVGFVIGR